MRLPTRRHHVALLLLLLLLGACASPGAAGRSTGSPDLLTEEQIRATSHATAHELIVALRPTWLRTRGMDSITNPGRIQVYVDHVRYGDTDTLHQISAISIRSIRWYDGISASTRWGLDHGNGVIFVSTGN